MKKNKELTWALAEKLDLPGDLVPGAGRVTVSGGRQAVIEGHRGILDYSEERVTVSFVRGRLSLLGSGLRLKAMNGDELLVEGEIQTAEWG